jgi:hypothetical protein
LKNEINRSHISQSSKEYLIEKLEKYSKDNHLNLAEISEIRKLIKGSNSPKKELKNEIEISVISL